MEEFNEEEGKTKKKAHSKNLNKKRPSLLQMERRHYSKKILEEKTKQLVGPCWIRENKGLKAWKYRKFDLIKNRLYWAKKDEDGDDIKRNFILLDENTVIETQNKHLPLSKGKPGTHGFKISTSYSVFFLAAASEEIRRKWIEIMQFLVDTLKEISLTDQLHYLDVYGDAEEENQPDDYPVLDIIVVEAVTEGLSAKIHVSLIHGRQKFTSWPSSANASIDCGCTFIWPADSLRVKLCSHFPIETTLGESIIDISMLKMGSIIDDWFPVREKAFEDKSIVGLVHLCIHKTTSNSPDALLSSKGFPLKTTPIRVNTGDVLLWQNVNLSGIGTVLLTQSQWNHVGMVVRWTDNTFKIFEATGDGVSLGNLESHIRASHMESTIAIRQLTATDMATRQNHLYKFIKSVEGRPFTSDVMTFIRAGFNSNTSVDQSSFFCSELVAAAFHSMGLVSKDLVCSNFLPKDWAADKIPFIDGAFLSKKYIFKAKSCTKARPLKEETLLTNEFLPLKQEEYRSLKRDILTTSRRKNKLNDWIEWQNTQKKRIRLHNRAISLTQHTEKRKTAYISNSYIYDVTLEINKEKSPLILKNQPIILKDYNQYVEAKKSSAKKKRMSHQYRLQTHPTHYIPDEDSDSDRYDSSNSQTDSEEETPQGISVSPPTPALRTNGILIKGTTPPNTPPPASPRSIRNSPTHSLLPLAENNVLSFNNTLLPSSREIRKRKKLKHTSHDSRGSAGSLQYSLDSDDSPSETRKEDTLKNQHLIIELQQPPKLRRSSYEEKLVFNNTESGRSRKHKTRDKVEKETRTHSEQNAIIDNARRNHREIIN